MQLRVLGHPGLYEQGGVPGVDAARQPVDHHVPDVLAHRTGFVVVGGERVPVGDEEIALVLVLEPHPVLQHAPVVSEMQLPGRTHPGNHPLMLSRNRAQMAFTPLRPRSL